jgi:DNA-binding GntR family transcriptional regulator
MVITGELPPGTLTSESRLAQILNCGRTPLREVLQRLSHEYVVRVEPRQGILIPELSIVDLQQIIDALLYLFVPHALELAAVRIDRSQIDGLQDIVKRAEQAELSSDFYELTQLDWRLHAAIAEATQNRYVGDAAKRLHSALARFVYASYEAAGSAKSSITEHEAIVEALGRKNPDLARQRFRDHMTYGRQRVLEVLGLGDFDPGPYLWGRDPA